MKKDDRKTPARDVKRHVPGKEDRLTKSGRLTVSEVKAAVARAEAEKRAKERK